MKHIDSISVGEKITHSITITEKMHNDFMNFSGDNSPIHSDKGFALSNGYQDRLGYAFLLTCVLSKIYGTIFPGGSELCLKQECDFPNLYYIGDKLEFQIEVINKNEELKLLTVMTVVKNQEGKVVFRGKAVFQLKLEETR